MYSDYIGDLTVFRLTSDNHYIGQQVIDSSTYLLYNIYCL